MNSIFIVIIAFGGYLIAYNTYGKYLARKIFGLSADAVTPAQEYRDDMDYLPAQKEILFCRQLTRT